MSNLIGRLSRIANPTPPTTGVAQARILATNRRASRGSGNFRVYGTVTVNGLPGARRVALLDRKNLQPIQVVWSADDGSYAFNYVSAAEKIVLGLDYLRQYNAVVADAVTPEPMP